MPDYRFFHLQRRLGFRGWMTVIAALAVAAGLTIAVAVVALGFLLIFVPLAIVAALAAYVMRSIGWRPRREQSGIIEGEFRVLDPDQIRLESREEKERR